MTCDWLAAIPVSGLVLWVVLCGLDDLFLQGVFLYLRLRGARAFRELPGADTRPVRHRRIAVFVPLWHEHAVIGRMLEHNLAAVRYGCYDFFVGVYPNDPKTAAAVAEVERRHPTVHRAICPHPGPTSKADCLNWTYQAMLAWEREHGERFEAVVIHDAEDLIHPESLETINAYLERYDMVQVPVLPLPTRLGEWTHGLYCDEFAEFQKKDIPVRAFLGGFIASNGVGTGFSRRALDALAALDDNRIFEPSCMTEDYDAGFRIHKLGMPQVFVPLRYPAGRKAGAGPMATREYFPRTFRAAARQRTRWVTGIALQGWARHGWRVSPGQIYWLWRDRKGLVGNLLNPLLNLLFLWGAAAWVGGLWTGLPMPTLPSGPPLLAPLCGFAMACSALQLAVRAACARGIYGTVFALGVLPRALLGNVLNCVATARALWRYFGATLQGNPLVWLKTDHCYPTHAALTVHKRRLGEILSDMGLVGERDLDEAVSRRPAGERLGEYLVRTGRLSEEHLYAALSLQQGLPLCRPAKVSRRASVTVPAAVARKWRILPFQACAGKLFVAGPDLPSDEMAEELTRWTRLEVRFHLVTPSDFRVLAREYLE